MYKLANKDIIISDESMVSLIFKNGNVLFPDGTFKKVDLRITGDLISEQDSNIIPGEGESVLDCSKKWITPGLIDAHCHLGLIPDGLGFQSSDGNESSNPCTPGIRALDGINFNDLSFRDAVKGGVTTVCVLPGSANPIGGTGVVIKTACLDPTLLDSQVVSPHQGLKMALGENPKNVYGQQKKAPITRMGTAKVIRENLLKAANSLKKEKSEHNHEKKDEFPAKMDKIDYEVLKETLEGKIVCRIHAHAANDILTAIRLKREFNLVIVLDHCSEGHRIPDIIKREGIPVVLGPTFIHRTKIETREKTFKSYGYLANKGIKVAIMSDHPASPIWYLNVYAGLAVREGMKPEDAMKAITIWPAEIIGVEKELGSIELGKKAELVVWNKHPLTLEAKPEAVYIEGQRVYNKEDDREEWLDFWSNV